MWQNLAVSNRLATVLIASLTLAGARLLGLHFHIADATSGEASGIVQPGAFETPHHHSAHTAPVTAHAEDEDVDVDDPASAVSKIPAPDASWSFIGIAFVLLALPLFRGTPVLSPPFRPPRIRSLRSLLPPSQAPPRNA